MRVVNTLKTLRQECGNILNEFITTSPASLNKHEKQIVREIQTQGFSIINDFYSPDQCALLRQEIDHLLEKFRDDMYVDAEDVDHRIFGADRVSSLMKDFYRNPFITRIIRAHEKTIHLQGLTMAARLEHRAGKAKGSGEGWHRDWAVNKQTKAILYLSDVAPENGPFQYIRHSHRHGNIVLDCLTEDFEFNQSRFNNESIDRLVAKKYKEELVTLPARAGTLIFANTRGLHRGKPIAQGVRYAMTNYYWNGMAIPKHIEQTIVRPK